MTFPRFAAVADHAVLVSFAQELDDTAQDLVFALDRAIASDLPEGVVECIPALVSLLVDFDPLLTDHVAIEAALRARLQGLVPQRTTGVEHCVEVCYDAAFAPDLGAVARACDLSEQGVVDAHLAGDYRVLMYGFAPGYAYLGGVPAALHLPRKAAAVRNVPAGSVIIAGGQCLVTTLTMPTGWSIIGRSPTPVLTGRSDKPFLFEVGDTVRFERVGASQMARGLEDD